MKRKISCGNAWRESWIERHNPTKKRTESLCEDCLERKRDAEALQDLSKSRKSDTEPSERFEEASNFSQLEYELDLTVFHPEELPYVIVQLQLVSEQASSQELKDFIEMIVSELRTEQLRRKK